MFPRPPLFLIRVFRTIFRKARKSVFLADNRHVYSPSERCITVLAFKEANLPVDVVLGNRLGYSMGKSLTEKIARDLNAKGFTCRASSSILVGDEVLRCAQSKRNVQSLMVTFYDSKRLQKIIESIIDTIEKSDNYGEDKT